MWLKVSGTLAMTAILVAVIALAVQNGAIGLSAEDNSRTATVPDFLEKPLSEMPQTDESSMLDKATEINLPGGEPLEIAWRRQPPVEYPMPPFEHQYEILRHQAESGNGMSALILHGIMQMCASAFDTEEELEEAIDLLQQTHSVRLPNMEVPATVSDPQQIPMFVQQMTTQYEDCSGLELQHESESTKWLKLAAEKRVPIAMIEYANQISDPNEAIDWFKGAWEEGESEGLMSMSNVYFANYNSGEKPEDNVKGFATLLAYTQLVETGMGGPDHGPVAHRQVQRIKNMLDEAKSTLKQYEIDEATALARKLIASNSNCCFEM